MVTVVASDRPAYRILSVEGFFGPNDHLYKEGDLIYFAGEPNEDMEPLNEPARERLRAYLKKLDDGARAVAEKNGRPFVGRPRGIDGAIAQATEDARRPQLIKGGPGVPIMGAKKDTANEIENIEEDAVPETGGKRPRQRVSDLTA